MSQLMTSANCDAKGVGQSDSLLIAATAIVLKPRTSVDSPIYGRGRVTAIDYERQEVLWTIAGDRGGRTLGRSMAEVGDLDGDGNLDVALLFDGASMEVDDADHLSGQETIIDLPPGRGILVVSSRSGEPLSVRGLECARSREYAPILSLRKFGSLKYGLAVAGWRDKNGSRPGALVLEVLDLLGSGSRVLEHEEFYWPWEARPSSSFGNALGSFTLAGGEVRQLVVADTAAWDYRGRIHCYDEDAFEASLKWSSSGRTRQEGKGQSWLGGAIAPIHDLNGDQVVDLAVTGRFGVAVFSGKDGETLHWLDRVQAAVVNTDVYNGYGASMISAVECDCTNSTRVFVGAEEWEEDRDNYAVEEFRLESGAEPTGRVVFTSKRQVRVCGFVCGADGAPSRLVVCHPWNGEFGVWDVGETPALVSSFAIE